MIKNYKQIEKKEIKELNAVGQLFVHEKSGARVVCLTNDDDNKAFSIAFRTPPADDTGLPHILEHSVLCGSRKFPIRDPFVELAKGSLNTFLNAMTFADKTVYPVASCNNKDFENLMDVYLDSVFYPNIYREDKILKQEGWHYELNNEKDPLSIKGVVYNEMKGAFSSPEQVLFRKIQQSLFPDNAYHFESGGDPDDIPKLTQENFLDFHKKYYHPSNSYIFLYGKLDIGEKLEWLHEKYLKEFDSIKVDSDIPKQNAFEKRIDAEYSYPVSGNESLDGKAYLSLNYVAGESTNALEYLSLDILEYILLEAPGAPLKKALLEAELGKDVFGSYDNSILQPTFSIVVKNSDESKKDKFIEIVEGTLKKLAQEGIEKKKIQAAINNYEFKTREADFGRYPKGIIYSLKSLDSWLYDGDPFIHFEYDEVFDKLKEGMEKGYFEELINKYLLNNSHSTLLILKPDPEMMSKKERELNEQLNSYKSCLSKEDVEKFVKETKALERYQSEEESKEDLATIPLLEIKDINKETEKLIVHEKSIENVRLIRHETFTNNIVYIQLNFDTKMVDNKLMPYLGILSAVLGKMDTELYEYSDLSSEINIHTGGMKFNVGVYGVSEEIDTFRPNFEISGKCFSDKVPKLFELALEMIYCTKFQDKNRLREIISETKSRVQMSLSSSGHNAAANRCESYFSPQALYKEWVNGIEYYLFLEKCEKEFDKNSDVIINNLNKLIHILFRPENLLIGNTAELEAFNIVDKQTENFVKKLEHDPIDVHEVDIKPEQKNEGFMTSGKIQYVAKAGNFIKAGFEYSGILRVLQTILSLDYLWMNVRVKGGAYGCMTSFKRNGNIHFVSYRDPNLIKTIDIYNEMYNYIKTFSGDEREMRKYIIGTISKLDIPLTPSMKNDRMLMLYFSNISHEQLQEERNEILAATSDDIRGKADLIKETLKQDYICVIGNEGKVKENSDLFKETLHLFD